MVNITCFSQHGWMVGKMVLCVSVAQSCLTFSRPPWTATHQAPLSMGFFRQEYWSWLSFPPLGDLLNPGTEPASLISPALAGGFFTTRATWEAQMMRYREPDPEGSRAQGLLSQWSLRCANLLACGGILAHPLGSSLNLYRRDFCDDSIMQARLMKSLATGE